jgi:hypothetical protein
MLFLVINVLEPLNNILHNTYIILYLILIQRDSDMHIWNLSINMQLT